MPVTILAGFLGAGKTTLIRYILQSPDHGKRIAVIENEFEQGLAIESLIARDGLDSSSLSDLIELPNGCICCTVKDNLVATFENLLGKRTDFDYILIECSGMANPGPIASIFWLDEAFESRLRLDGIVTLCDAAHFQATEEASQQVAYADRIVLDKVDLIKEGESSRPFDAFTPRRPCAKALNAAIPNLDWILDAQCFELDRIKEVDELLTRIDGSKASDDHNQQRGEHCLPRSCRSHTHNDNIDYFPLLSRIGRSGQV